MNAGAAARFLIETHPISRGSGNHWTGSCNDTALASDIIQRIRDLIKKAPPRKDNLDINEAIRDND